MAMRLSGRQALRTRQESKRLGGFSKKWQSGKTLTVLYPVYFENGIPNILTAAEWGHKIDPKALGLGRIFIPTNSEMVDNQPTTRDTLNQFSAIASLFLKGEYNEKLASLRRKAGQLPESVMKQKEAELDKEYGLENGIIKKAPAVGRLTYVVSTEVIAIPLKEDGSPDIKEAGLVTQDLSDDKLRKLHQIADTAKFELTEDNRFLEVTYTFGTSGDRMMDGRVDPVGVTPDYRISTRYPEAWEAIKSYVDSLPEDTAVIRKRNNNYEKVEERKILQAIQTYSVVNSELLDQLNDETDIERLKRNAELLRSLDIAIENPEVQEAIADLDKLKIVHETQTTDSTSTGDEAQEETAPSITSLLTDEELQEARNLGSQESNTGEALVGGNEEDPLI